MKRCREAIGQPGVDVMEFRCTKDLSSQFPLATSSVPQSTTSPPPTRPVPKPWRDALAGALSGAFARTVTAPIERVKLILQLQGSTKHRYPNQPGGAARWTAWDVCRQIYQEEGILSFWRGNWQNVLRVAGQAGLHFALMDYYKSLASSPWLLERGTLLQQQKDITDSQQEQLRRWVVSFVAGGLSGATTTTLLYPTEFLRTRLALDLGRNPTVSSNANPTRAYRGIRDIFVEVLRTDGIRGIYNGYGISLAGSVLYRLLYLGGYDAAKDELLLWKRRRQIQYDQLGTKRTSSDNSVNMTWTERFILAQIVSLSAGTICYPIDSVRRRMMMQAGKPMDERKYRNSFQCFRVVWANEGLRGFYLGFGPNIIRSIGGALALVAYDALKTTLG